MPHTQRKAAPTDEAAAPRHGKYKLDELDAKRIARNLVIFEPSDAVITDLVAKARLTLPGIAPAEEALRVQKYNPICIMALARKSKFDPANPVGEGFIAILPLNALGLQVLALDSFDALHPDLRLIAGPSERPAGIYMWGVFAPGSLAAGIALFMDKMSSPQYAGVSLYSRPVTEMGRKYQEVLGLTQGVQIGAVSAPHIWTFPRAAQPPAYDTYVPRKGDKTAIGITVARTFDDLMKVIAIRDAVYVGEQECPYDEEYDGNDLTATHLLAYIGDEPAGCLRLRFFADFAKFERVAIRKEFRKSRAAIKLVQAGLKLCQKKGYRRVIGHAQTRLTTFWTRFGFQPMEGRKPFFFSDYDYIEMVAELDPDPDAITITADPYVAIRPEGRWHTPGILEQSLSRPATNPSVAKKA
ncbi:MAG: GNAT family N-acetyltransferase [Alphaproteobacteria bacterium]